MLLEKDWRKNISNNIFYYLKNEQHEYCNITMICANINDHQAKPSFPEVYLLIYLFIYLFIYYLGNPIQTPV